MRHLCLALLIACSPAAAQQDTFKDYEEVRDNVFWSLFYVNVVETL